MRIKSIAEFIAVINVSILLAAFVSAQNNGQTRSITSDDFASQRPAAKTPSSRPTASNRRRNTPRVTYKFVRKGASAARWKSKTAKSGYPNIGSPAKVLEIGVTLWKLRPALRVDSGFKLPVNVSGLIQMWTAERVGADSVFRAGDRIRLAVESPVSGYLYVINSEVGTGGSLGQPSLIFPASANDENSVVPGMLIDIPDQREDLPYFIMNPKKDNYAGEAIAVVISPVQLRIKTDSNGMIKDVGDVFDQNFIDEAEVFTRTDWKDKIYANVESLAACGAKSRKLEREASAMQPCGASSRQLTREDPLPQTIYRVKSSAGKPAVAFIELKTI